jgi:hypothetical protein
MGGKSSETYAVGLTASRCIVQHTMQYMSSKTLVRWSCNHT